MHYRPMMPMPVPPPAQLALLLCPNSFLVFLTVLQF